MEHKGRGWERKEGREDRKKTEVDLQLLFWKFICDGGDGKDIEHSLIQYFLPSVLPLAGH